MALPLSPSNQEGCSICYRTLYIAKDKKKKRKKKRKKEITPSIPSDNNVVRLAVHYREKKKLKIKTYGG